MTNEDHMHLKLNQNMREVMPITTVDDVLWWKLLALIPSALQLQCLIIEWCYSHWVKQGSQYKSQQNKPH